jgi:hypothetical protein
MKELLNVVSYSLGGGTGTLIGMTLFHQQPSYGYALFFLLCTLGAAIAAQFAND